MKLPTHLAKQISQIHFGGNWTAVNLKDTLNDVSWEDADTQIQSFNTIAKLVHHMNYYIAAVTKVLEGEPLNAKDHLSFNYLPIKSQLDWDALRTKSWLDAEQFAELI